ncbi:hypothetical protein Tco_0941006 [Tanacetum coccineum]|uniref:Uncharacterized protein n=1 Tax=Tanacetum coccineum TaxID=301880 RepID=A0ABQ5DPL1_9ASTR
MRCLHIRAMVAGKDFVFEETIRADLLFNDADGIDCFLKQVLWDSLRDIGYEGNLAQLTFSKPLFSPQWKYLVHVLLHCLSPKSTSWEQFGTNIASALALAAEEAHSTSPHSRAASSPRDAQGTPTQSAAQDSSLQGTADFQGTAETQGAADIPQSPNDYTPTDASQTSGGDEGLLDLYALNREKAKEDEQKSDIEEEKDTSDVKSGDTEELDLEEIQSTARQSTVTPRTLNFEMKQIKRLRIHGPMQSQPQQPTQATDPKEKDKDEQMLQERDAKRLFKEEKSLTLQSTAIKETKLRTRQIE